MRVWMWWILWSRLGFRKISLKRCASVELVSELYYCHTRMTALVMRDVNTGYTFERAHRRHLLAALNERSSSVRGPTLPRTKTTGNVHTDDFVVFSALQLSDVHVDSSPIGMQRTAALYEFFQMRTHAGKSGSTLSGEAWGHSAPFSRPSFAHACHDARRCCRP